MWNSGATTKQAVRTETIGDHTDSEAQDRTREHWHDLQTDTFTKLCDGEMESILGWKRKELETRTHVRAFSPPMHKTLFKELFVEAIEALKNYNSPGLDGIISEVRCLPDSWIQALADTVEELTLGCDLRLGNEDPDPARQKSSTCLNSTSSAGPEMVLCDGRQNQQEVLREEERRRATRAISSPSCEDHCNDTFCDREGE